MTRQTDNTSTGCQDVALISRVKLIVSGLTNEDRFNGITSPVLCFIAQHKQHTIRVNQNMLNCPADDVVKAISLFIMNLCLTFVL